MPFEFRLVWNSLVEIYVPYDIFALISIMFLDVFSN